MACQEEQAGADAGDRARIDQVNVALVAIVFNPQGITRSRAVIGDRPAVDESQVFALGAVVKSLRPRPVGTEACIVDEAGIL